MSKSLNADSNSPNQHRIDSLITGLSNIQHEMHTFRNIDLTEKDEIIHQLATANKTILYYKNKCQTLQSQNHSLNQKCKIQPSAIDALNRSYVDKGIERDKLASDYLHLKEELTSIKEHCIEYNTFSELQTTKIRELEDSNKDSTTLIKSLQEKINELKESRSQNVKELERARI